MDANDARKIASEAQVSAAQDDTDHVNRLVEYVRKRIKTAAEKRQFMILNPLGGIRTPVSESQKLRVAEALAKDGFHISGRLEAVSWEVATP